MLGKDTRALLTNLLVKVGGLFHRCNVHLQVPETVKQPALTEAVSTDFLPDLIGLQLMHTS